MLIENRTSEAANSESIIVCINDSRKLVLLLRIGRDNGRKLPCALVEHRHKATSASHKVMRVLLRGAATIYDRQEQGTSEGDSRQRWK